MAYLKRAIQFIFLAVVLTGLWFSFHRVLTGQDYSLEIEKIILEGKDSNRIDLTQFKPGVWNEIAIWYPYSDVRDFKIDGVYLLFESSNINSDDGNNILLFIKDNQIKGHAVFSRRKVDFATFDLDAQRIVRDKAVFKFNSSVDFSKVQFLEKK